MEKKKKIEWDYKLEDKIHFFDPTKSYQISGFRPISMTEGLDFNPEPFQTIYKYKVEHGVHCEFNPGTKGFKDFWLQEIEKCKNGVTINGYTITGDHYFFLNYYRLLNVKDVGKAAGGRLDTAPSFWSKHYEYFHYLEICKRAGFDCCVLKSRGVGFSEVAASLGACIYTCVRNSKCYYTAAAENYLLKNGVLQKVWDELEFLNQETEGALRHVRMKKNEPMWKRASSLTTKGEESGWMAEIFGQVVDSPRKVRGARVEYLFLEEAGSYPDLITIWNQCEALVKLLGKRIGIRCAWGKMVLH